MKKIIIATALSASLVTPITAALFENVAFAATGTQSVPTSPVTPATGAIGSKAEVPAPTVGALTTTPVKVVKVSAKKKVVAKKKVAAKRTVAKKRIRKSTLRK